ncbi:Kinetochore protein mis14 [Trichoderma ghanense]|uniref:Kinetochore protein mis14 n=1 Tax=Trichoderma ghanense TaxID=65468 RepID=A0ABY2HK49_9HYPO
MDSESVVAQVQRKIELQSPEDLAYLITNVRNAAVEHLNEAFPPVDGAEEDELRIQIEVLVNEYINKTFSLAAPNLTINGLPVPPAAIVAAAAAMPPDTVYEPFDTRKRRQVADLITQEEKLLEDVAALKRSVPAKVAAEHAERVRAAMRQDEDDLRERVARDAAAAEASAAAGGLLPGVTRLQRQEGVEDGFKSAVQGLGRLKRDMPAVVAKMERARVAGEYVVTRGR